MKVGEKGQFDTLKNIACGHKLKMPPSAIFRQGTMLQASKAVIVIIILQNVTPTWNGDGKGQLNMLKAIGYADLETS